MEKLLKEINNLRFAITGTPLTQPTLKKFQAELDECGFPSLPEIVVSFLKKYNGILLENRCIWGINPNDHFRYDILGENAIAQNPYPNELLLLGASETTFIGYLQSTDKFSILDRHDFSVIHEFNNFQNAVRYILKIDD